ncbi:RNA-guided endonuclease InsQ/TnpB family protein [Stutzerimonas kunmingensis]|uniref:RNA-guided endonuclease InsQ/TnpB family protein n=1 Tax=Stutzerimonas kunmingensis TaxID=1211807 RepID=UPI00241FA8DB|nr:transposase [Stutzerimonas kunmingensis]
MNILVQTGIRLKAYPTAEQAKSLSQWIGCARVIWNAKCDEDHYLRTFARKYLPLGTFPEPNKQYSHFKSEETAWLKKCPSQLLRNSATIWHSTYMDFLKGRCGRPRNKSRERGNYIWITRELFNIVEIDGRWELHIGSKTNSLGVLKVRWHHKPKHPPNSIWIRVEHGRWSVSFSYENGQPQPVELQEHLDWLRGAPEHELDKWVVGIDRGVARPIQTPYRHFKPDDNAIARQEKRERYIKRLQRKLARQIKGSNRRGVTKRRIAGQHRATRNVRDDFLHKASRALVNDSKVVVLEDLKLKNMSRAARPKQCPETGRWLRNGASAKSGLNRSLLGVGLFKFEQFMRYKMEKANKPMFKVSAYNTSRECAVCGHTHEANRQSQATFHCQSCGHTDNADRNAACVIKKHAIRLIKDSGTELTSRGVLRPAGPLGRASNGSKTTKGAPEVARRARSKKMVVPA